MCLYAKKLLVVAGVEQAVQCRAVQCSAAAGK
jgi:hypothetical protein